MLDGSANDVPAFHQRMVLESLQVDLLGWGSVVTAVEMYKL